MLAGPQGPRLGGTVIRAFQGKMPKIHETAFIADTADVIGDVEIGEQASVWFQTVIRGDVNSIRIGSHTNIQDGTVIHVDSGGYPVDIADHVTLGHAVRLHGARIGPHCLIGIAAVVLNGVVMEEECIVAAGSVVSPGTHVPRRTLMMGVPARPKRMLTDADLELIYRPTRNYVRLAAQYRGEA